MILHVRTGKKITIDQLADLVHEQAAVAWDRDVAPLELPMDPVPRLFRPEDGHQMIEIVFGDYTKPRTPVAIWATWIQEPCWVIVPKGTEYDTVRALV